MDKIEEIRKKPEHIRLRYVWFFVALSMVLVIILWVFSLKVPKQEIQNESTGNNLFNSDMLDQFADQKKALEDINEQAQDSLFSPESTLNQDVQNNQPQNNLDGESGQ